MELHNPMGFWASSSKIILQLLVFVAMNLSANASANRLNNETDRIALLEFKHQISDDPLGVLSSWNHSQNHCQWQGVTCGRRHQRVTALTLSGKSLSGTISPHIGNLSFLKFIHFGGNQFRGKIPQEVGSLFRLRFLNLSSNTLSGEIPVDISNCSEMISISLAKNKLEGRIPFQLTNLEKLELLTFYQNMLTGKIPSSMGNLSSLTTLNLGQNHLEGNLPIEMGMLTNLSMLAVGVNKLSGVFPASVYNISALTIISLADNSFHGNLPSNIGHTLPNLQAIGAVGNKFYGKIPISITNASGLEILDLSGNKFEGKVPINLGHLSNLQRLGLGWNFLGSSSRGDLGFVASLTNCSNLQIVVLSNNNFGGEMPKVIANLSYQLTQFRIATNRLSGTIPEGLGSLVNLYHFQVAYNSLSGEMPSDFGKFQNLQFLGLYGNRLSGEILSTICNVTTLFRLDLGNNLFHGRNIFGDVLMNCQNLQFLDVSQNNLSGVIPPHSFDMHSSLVYLSLAQNTFTGSLPLDVGKLIHLMQFDVSYNNFSGAIPIELGDCSGMEYLYMQGNFFHGIISPNLASLKSIQQLDLSSNNLIGRIPTNLERLQYLRYLNLSYNSLEGEIPTTGVFGNATQISLAGDNKLCGGIPELNFPSCPMNKGKNKRNIKVFILSTVLPINVLVLGMVLFYFVIYQKRNKRMVGLSMVPTKADKLLRVSYYELHGATSGFSPENLIGSGSFGAVYKGRLDRHGDRLVAIKVLNLQKSGASKSFQAECKALRNIRHRNLVSILSCCSGIDSKGHEFKALISEFMENGNLDLWLHPGEATEQTTTSRKLDFFQRLNIAIHVASALHYLHNESETTIVHCDIKPSNVLLDNDFVAHLGDFGLARLLPKTINTTLEQGTSSTVSIRGSIGYAAPEYGMGLPISTLGDVYAYGILLLEMFTAKRPTDDMFMNGLDLHNYAKSALPEQVCMIVDPLLLPNGDNTGEVTAQVELCNDEKMMQCIDSILKIGIKCSAALPNDRMPMDEIIRKLHLIKDAILGTRINIADLDI